MQVLRSKALNNNNSNEARFKHLRELDQNIDWDNLVEAVLPHYIHSNISPLSLTVENMLRIYILGQHFSLTPSATIDALNHIDYLKEFALINLDNDEIPNECCISEFNSILNDKSLTLKIKQALSMNALENNNLVTH